MTTNFNPWSKSFRSFMDQKNLSPHFENENFDASRKEYEFPTIKESRYFARKQIILEKPLVNQIVEVKDARNIVLIAAVAKYDLKDRNDEIYALQEEAEYKAEARSFELDRTKA